MGLILQMLVCTCLCAGVYGVSQISWLPCQFTDEQVLQKEFTETELLYRQVILQFGQPGDPPVNPHAVTFLVTASKLDMRRYLKEAEEEQLDCELKRYSTEGIHVRWPVLGAHGYNYWFSCTIRHRAEEFTVTSFLRQASDQPPPGQQDYRNWPEITDGEILTTTVALVMKTETPVVRATLGSQQKFHCHFDVDHKGPNFTAEWHFQKRGTRTKLFSYSSRSGRTEGSGVSKKGLSGGEASFTHQFTRATDEGTFLCSLSVMPIFASVEINLRVEDPPRVSINVGPTLSLQEGDERKIVCEADGYYPLDVDIVWYEQDPAVAGQRVGAPLPKKLPNILLSSHRHNKDMTYTMTAFFYLEASLMDSGKQFTCSVSHVSLRAPIKKNFILTVKESVSWMFVLSVGFIVITLSSLLVVMLCYLYSIRKKSSEKKPY
ncbi:tapasin-like [Salarias fasciatus]|uniref:Tapasin-like n=1 Tax=Salarias fasciatus TaxID=181472 RepID=A0A672JF51_SALFA|nr:tapasin-like [Salarias fasciatus]